MDKKKKIILVDDHIVVRNGLKQVIESFGPYEVVTELDNGSSLIDNPALLIDADLILLDQEMPLMTGTDVMSHFHKNNIKVPVLMLTLSENETLIVRLFRLGVRGYLHKNCRSATLREAIEQILDKGYYHNEFLIQALTKEPSKMLTYDPATVQSSLTEKEKKLLVLVCDEKEYTYEQIADILGVHRRTVDNYKQSICDKFNIKSKTGLVLFAIRNKIVELI